MKRISLATCAMCTLLMVACGPNREKELKQINLMEDSLRQATFVADSTTSAKMLGLYLQFAKDFPKDTLTPGYLYNASDLALNIGRYNTSIGCLKQIIDNYPNFDEASTCYFLIGNAYEESGNLDSAVIAYNEFIRLYPDHPLAESAQFAVKNIGLPLDQVLKNILADRTQDSVQ